MRRAWPAMLLLGAYSAQAGDGEPPSAAGSWPQVLACVEDLVPDPNGDPAVYKAAWDKVWKCGKAADEVARLGGDVDRERLWTVFDGVPEASPLRSYILDAALDSHLSRALEGLEGAAAASPAVAGADIALPEFLEGAPAELQGAWRVFESVSRAGAQARPEIKEGEGIAFQSHEPAFQRAVAEFLRGRTGPAETVRELTRFEWGGWCGMGSDALYQPQSKALLLAYLGVGRLDLAVGVSGGVQGWSLPGEGMESWDHRLLAAAGIDWERFHLGGVMAGRSGFADALAHNGSDLTAQQLLMAAQFLGEKGRKRPEGWMASSDDLLWPLAALVEPTRSCSDYARGNSREVQRDPSAPAVSGAVQEGVLEILAERIGPEAGLGEADAASHLLVHLCRPESGPAFRAMLRSPYSDVRQRGAIGLRGLGETVAEPKASLPVRFRVLVDGKPIAGQDVRWTLVAEGVSVSSGGPTDGEGLLSLARDPFVDPHVPLSAVVLGFPSLKSPGEPWFELRLVPPRDLDRVTTAAVRTGSLTVVIPEAQLKRGERPPTIMLMGESSRYGSAPISVPMTEPLPVTSRRMTFPHLQHGRYTVLYSRGTRNPLAPVVVEVGEHPATAILPERARHDQIAEDVPEP